jgi:hypothetical protein
MTTDMMTTTQKIQRQSREASIKAPISGPTVGPSNGARK